MSVETSELVSPLPDPHACQCSARGLPAYGRRTSPHRLPPSEALERITNKEKPYDTHSPPQRRPYLSQSAGEGMKFVAPRKD